jgi:hypothetical protein
MTYFINAFSLFILVIVFITTSLGLLIKYSAAKSSMKYANSNNGNNPYIMEHLQMVRK